MASTLGSRATLATKLVPRSSIGFLSAQITRHLRSRLQCRAHDRRVAGATAQMPGQQVANRRFVRPRMFPQEAIERHQNAGRAKAALKRMVALERRLQDAKAIRRGREAFDCAHLAAVDLHREREAGPRRLAVHVAGAGAAYAVFAAGMGAGWP